MLSAHAIHTITEMRVLLLACVLFLTGCVVRDQSPIKTQVVTYPEGATVEFNGRPVGRAPAAVVLPQDTNGRLTERTILRAVPNTGQSMLIAQTRVLEPGVRTDRVPDQIMIDLTLRDTNTSFLPVPTQVQAPPTTNTRPARARPSGSSKPTRPVGIDRWNPGIY
jgi:hypothetical protein